MSSQKSAQTVVNDGYGDYLLVPAGEFLMGDNFNDEFPSSKGWSQEKPVHSVNLTAYYIGKYEVTNGEFKKFIDDGGYTNPAYWTEEERDRATSGAEKDQRKNRRGNIIERSYGRQPEFWNDSTASGGGIPGNENFPVVGVNLHEANAYCANGFQKRQERPTGCRLKQNGRKQPGEQTRGGFHGVII